MYEIGDFMKVLVILLSMMAGLCNAQSAKILEMYNCKNLIDSQVCNSQCTLDKNNKFSYKVDMKNSTITWFLFDKNNVLKQSKTADFCKIFNEKNLICNAEQIKLSNGDYSHWGVANGIYWSEFHFSLSESQKYITYTCAK